MGVKFITNVVIVLTFLTGSVQYIQIYILLIPHFPFIMASTKNLFLVPSNLPPLHVVFSKAIDGGFHGVAVFYLGSLAMLI